MLRPNANVNRPHITASLNPFWRTYRNLNGDEQAGTEPSTRNVCVKRSGLLLPKQLYDGLIELGLDASISQSGTHDVASLLESHPLQINLCGDLLSLLRELHQMLMKLVLGIEGGNR